MNRPNIFFLPVLLVLLLFIMWDKDSKADSSVLYEQQKMASHLLVNMFLEKVDQGELSIFDHTLQRTDLTPHHVAFIHTLADDEMKAQLCFMLTRRIVIPDFEDFYVEKITVDMDKDGNITEISTHVSPAEQLPDEGDEQDPAIQ